MMELDEKIENFILERKDAPEALDLMQEYLSMNPVFRLYERWKKEDVPSVPASGENPTFYMELLKTDKAMESPKYRGEILRKMAACSKSVFDKIRYAKMCYFSSLDKKDLLNAGILEYEVGIYEDAYSDFKESMPDSAVWLFKCYLLGQGTKKNKDHALKALTEGIKGGNEDALRELTLFVKKQNIKDPEILSFCDCGTLHVPSDVKRRFLSIYEQDGYIDEKTLLMKSESISQNEIRKFLLRYGIKVVPTIDLPSSPIGRLKYLFTLIPEGTRIPEYLRYYELTEDLVDFYADLDENEEKAHTPAEASLFLDIPMEESERRYEKLLMYLECDHARRETKNYIYYYTYYYKEGDMDVNGYYVKEFELGVSPYKLMAGERFWE